MPLEHHTFAYNFQLAFLASHWLQGSSTFLNEQHTTVAVALASLSPT